MKCYKVGGCIRDRFLGVLSKDIDIAVEGVTYEQLRDWLLDNDYRLCEEDPDFLRIKAGKRQWGGRNNKLELVTHRGEDRWLPVAMSEIPKDWVLCRKDGRYSDARRPDTVEPATIWEDLARRDFTVNAIAIDMETGEMLDPYNGKDDIEQRILRCVGDAFERFEEDPLRLFRAIRIAIEKGFVIHGSTWNAIVGCNDLVNQVEPNRIREELLRAFKGNTRKTLMMLSNAGLIEYAFNERTQLWLKPTCEK